MITYSTLEGGQQIVQLYMYEVLHNAVFLYFLPVVMSEVIHYTPFLPVWVLSHLHWKERRIVDNCLLQPCRNYKETVWGKFLQETIHLHESGSVGQHGYPQIPTEHTILSLRRHAAMQVELHLQRSVVKTSCPLSL